MVMYYSIVEDLFRPRVSSLCDLTPEQRHAGKGRAIDRETVKLFINEPNKISNRQ